MIYSRLAASAPTWLGLSVLAAITAAVVFRWRQKLIPPAAAEAVTRWLLTQPKLRPDGVIFALGCSALIWALDGPGLINGFFRQDDFAFVADARNASELLASLTQYHNDHSLPLYRIEVWTLLQLGGPEATVQGLAAVFNAANFLTGLGVLLTGAWLLAELSARRAALVAFCFATWFWPAWGEYNAGFYTISVYPQTLAAGFAATAALLRHGREGNPGWALFSLAASAVAAALDISGMWIFPTLLFFKLAARGRAMGTYLTGLVALGAIAAAYHLIWAAHPLSPRELVQHPAHELLRASLLPNIAERWWRLPFDAAATFGGVMLGGVGPPVLQILEPRIDGSPVSFAFVVALELIATAAAILVWRQSHRATPGGARALLMAALAPAVMIILLTIAARPGMRDVAGLFWPAKYSCLPYCWIVLWIVLLLDRWLLAEGRRGHLALGGLFAAIAMGAWASALFWSVERAVALDAPWLPGGRYANVHAAIARRADYAAFQSDLEKLAASLHQREMALPGPIGGYWHYRFLEIGSHPTLGANYVLEDLCALEPSRGLKVSIVPSALVSAETKSALKKIPALEALFSGPP